MKWVRWNPDVDIPFNAAQAVYLATSGSMNSKMVGNGEHLFAAHVDGSVSSDDSFDVIGSHGERYEIKSLGNFRFSYDKTTARIVHDRLIAISNEIVYALSGTSFNEFYDRAIDISSRPYVGVKKIMGRTYKNGRKQDIGISQIVHSLHENFAKYGDKEEVEIMLAEHLYVSVPQFINLCRVAKAYHDEEFTEIDEIYSKLDDECFNTPMVINLLWNSIKSSETLLTHCDKLVIVNRDKGYIILDKEDIDRFVLFTGFSKGEAHFRTTKELKEVQLEIMERNTTSRQLDFTKRFGNYGKKEQENTSWYCDCLAYKDGRD